VVKNRLSGYKTWPSFLKDVFSFMRYTGFIRRVINYLPARALFILFSYSQLVSFSSCQKKSADPGGVLIFDSVPIAKPLNPVVNEISGVADSRANAGYLWGQEDSGNPPQLYLVSHDGSLAKTIYIKGVTNRDWEDMALSGNDIFIAETGDNGLAFSEYVFYRFPEPLFTTDTVRNAEAIRFKYADGPHDAEAFLVDPASKDIFIITKRDSPSKIFRLAYPYSSTSLNTAAEAGTLPYSGVVSAAISADGKEILIKTYPAVFYYKRSNGESIDQALRKIYTQLPYKMEPLGEALGFARDNSGFYTLSEKGFGSSVNLYFYKRR
jgi:hypothetical protein